MVTIFLPWALSSWRAIMNLGASPLGSCLSHLTWRITYNLVSEWENTILFGSWMSIFGSSVLSWAQIKTLKHCSRTIRTSPGALLLCQDKPWSTTSLCILSASRETSISVIPVLKFQRWDVNSRLEDKVPLSSLNDLCLEDKWASGMDGGPGRLSQLASLVQLFVIKKKGDKLWCAELVSGFSPTAS